MIRSPDTTHPSIFEVRYASLKADLPLDLGHTVIKVAHGVTETLSQQLVTGEEDLVMPHHTGHKPTVETIPILSCRYSGRGSVPRTVRFFMPICFTFQYAEIERQPADRLAELCSMRAGRSMAEGGRTVDLFTLCKGLREELEVLPVLAPDNPPPLTASAYVSELAIVGGAVFNYMAQSLGLPAISLEASTDKG
jgi:hypothetical protein